MINKIVETAEAAVADISEGASIMIGGFGDAGVPNHLIDALVRRRVGGLTVIANNAGGGDVGIALLFRHGLVRKICCSFPRSARSVEFQARYNSGEVELELIPQGTMAERMRAAGAGIGGFYTPTGVGTVIEQGKEIREIDGRQYLLELPLSADYALVEAAVADRYGNLRYRLAARNFNPVMAMAARVTIAQARRIVEPGELAPDDIHTPGIFVDRVVLG
jgi:3-oxoadipate CoA-transferase alpha subunit